MIMQTVEDGMYAVFMRALLESTSATRDAVYLEAITSLFGNRCVTYLTMKEDAIPTMLDAVNAEVRIYADNLIAELAATAVISVSHLTSDPLTELTVVFNNVLLAISATKGLSSEYREFFTNHSEDNDITGIIFYIAANALARALLDIGNEDDK